jgi:glycine oxidase
MTDCLIVGGGLLGMFTARELVGEGLSVRILERGEVGAESSWAGGGILSPLYPWRAPDPITHLAAWSQGHYPKLVDSLQAESRVDPEWEPTGMLILDTEEAVAARNWARDHGRRLELVDASEMAELEPSLRRGVERAIWLPEVANLRNPRLVRALRGSLEYRNVPIHEGVNVEGWLVDEGRVRGVTTDVGEFEAPRVVVAGGAWSGGLLAGTGVHAPVQPVRGQMVVFRAPQGRVRRTVLHHDHYIIPRRDGHVLAGSTLEEAGFDKSVTPEGQQALVRSATELVPGLAECPVEHHWAGLRPGSPDGVPFIGPHPAIEGVFLNTGHFRNGVVMGPASARLLADLMLGRTPALDPSPYRPHPFRPSEAR